MKTIIKLPHLYEPRPYQLPFLQAFDSGYRRLIQIWHRRSGKDKTDLNLVIREMQTNVGNYYYAFPTYSQGRKAIWEGRGKDGIAYRDHFPKELIEKTHDGLMQIWFKNGSLFQIVGVEDADTLVGTNPRGIVFSEYSLQNPKAWDLMRPILAENEGWAIFNYTPRGKNHGFKLFEMASTNPRWFVSKLTVDGTHALKQEDIDEERRSGMTEDLIQQEFYCSFISAIQGSIYWPEIDAAQRNGQFKDVMHDPKMMVHTVWDLGKNDTNCIGFYQSDGVTIRKIDYMQGSRKGLPDWIKLVNDRAKERGYNYGRHYAPHDIEVSDYSVSGEQTRREVARALKFEFEVVPKLSMSEGIEAGKRLFKKMVVDKTRCSEWLEAIPQYSREYDEDNKIFKDKPLHDWTSHYADEHRYAALIHHLFDNEGDMTLQESIEVTRYDRQTSARSDAGL